jgi:hypothetical protein
MMRVEFSGDGGGDSSTPWDLFQGATNEGASPLDPGALTSAASYDSGTGLFSWTFNPAHVAAVDGYQENLARWTIPLSTLQPSFDPTTDLLELFFDIDSSVASTARTGLAIGLLDRQAAGGSVGFMHGVYTTPGWVSIALSATATGGTATSHGSSVDGLYCGIRFMYDGAAQARMQHILNARLSTGFRGGTLDQTTLPAVSPAAAFHVHVAGWHNAITAPGAADTWTGKLYHRRVRLGASAP